MNLRNSLAGAVKNTAARCGIGLSSYPMPYTFERNLGNYLKEHRIECVLDVGAYLGQYAMLLRRVGFTGRIISFEPVKSSYDQLSAAMRRDSHWTGMPFGLSDTSTTVQMHTYGPRGDFNSLHRLSTEAHAAYRVPEGNAQGVTMRRLDEIFTDLFPGRTPRLYLKMDTQGHDLAVFHGARGVLDKIIGLQSEIPAIRIYDNIPSMPDLLACYASHQFFPLSFHEVNHVRNGMVPEFDVILHHAMGSEILSRDLI